MSPTNPPSQPQSQTRPLFIAHQQSSTSSASSWQSNGSNTSLPTPLTTSAPIFSPEARGPSNQQAQQSPLHTQAQAQQSRQPVQRTPSFDYRPNREGAGRTAAETDHFLSQTGLLAEAAKRAQMAVLMRDVEEMEL